jgi:hypothetical protein
MRDRLRQLRSWLAGDRRRQTAAAGAATLLLLAVVAGALAAAGAFSGGSPEAVLNVAPTATPTPVPTPAPSPTPPPTEPTLLDGVLVYPEQLTEIQGRLPLAVMFDNFVDARPQVGLEKADLVFEVVAEGGITRFLGVFWRGEPGRIVPVRSARVYYLDWAAELDAVYVHWGWAKSGGAADVPSAIAGLGLRHLDGFFLSEPYFFRAPDRLGPHDGIADTDALWELAAERGWTGPPAIEAWRFKEDEPERAQAEGAAASTIDLGFGGPMSSGYSVRWQYDAGSNAYLRSQGGAPHKDGGSGRQFAARNVAVMITTVRSAGDGTAHLLYDTVGGGEAVVFQDGVAVPGAWSKPDTFSRTRFFDAAGNEIAFNRGQTWVEVLAVGDPLAY